VDATNYAMLEVGSRCTLDYECCCSGRRRAAHRDHDCRSGERLTTLDGVQRSLDDFTILVADTQERFPSEA
jgi:phenylalanyl-tRNA synthetase beta subunit